MGHISKETKAKHTKVYNNVSLPCSHYLSPHALHDETKTAHKLIFDNHRTIIFSHLDKRLGTKLIFLQPLGNHLFRSRHPKKTLVPDKKSHGQLLTTLT